MYCQNCKERMIKVTYVIRKRKCLQAYYCTMCGELIHIKGIYTFRIWRGRRMKRIAFIS